MAENSRIEWTHHTFNPWIGCQKVSPGCDNCLAPDTLVLYQDRAWRPLAEVQAGDELLGFPESGGTPADRLETATVEKVWKVRERALEIRTPEHGIIASYGHPFAARKAARVWGWKEPRNFSLLTTQLRVLPDRVDSRLHTGIPAVDQPVIGMTDVGETDLIDIQTSTGTFFANGFAVHNCYAETLSNLRGWTEWGPQGKRVRTSLGYWKKPLSWERRARREGTRYRVFCASLADVFDNQAPPGAREELFGLIRETPSLDWQLLTKRPQNLESMLPTDWTDQGYPNVWLGVSAENQEEYDRRWPLLAQTPASLRFISYEPALGALTMQGHPGRPDWVIWGGESGKVRRDMDPQWARSITRECAQEGIPVFGKQWGDYRNNPLVMDLGLTPKQARSQDPPANGKGGALLDGRMWREFPTPGTLRGRLEEQA